MGRDTCEAPAFFCQPEPRDLISSAPHPAVPAAPCPIAVTAGSFDHEKTLPHHDCQAVPELFRSEIKRSCDLCMAEPVFEDHVCD